MGKFIKDMISNPDGSYSTKRTSGWVCLFASLAVAIFSLITPNVNEVIAITLYGGFLGAFLGALGISTIDTKSYWLYKGQDSKAYWDNNQVNSSIGNYTSVSRNTEMSMTTSCPCPSYPNCECGKKENGK